MYNIKSNARTSTTKATINNHYNNNNNTTPWIWLIIFLLLCNCPLYDLKQQQQQQQQYDNITTTTNRVFDNNNNILQIVNTYKLNFHQSVYNVSIPENSIGKTYASLAAGEELLGIKLPRHVPCTVKYRIINGDKDKLFKAEERLVGDFAFLTLRTRTSNVVLNREKHDHYMLRVRANINCLETPTQEAETLVHLRVLDRNDLSPLFYPTTYEITIPEDTPLHSSIIRVFAEDADIGINGEIYYSFQNTQNDYFAIHPTSGVITLMRALNFNDYSRYDLSVLAHDRGSTHTHSAQTASSANVSIIVEQVNLYSPEIYVNALSSFTSNVSALIYGIVRVTDRDYNRHGEIRSLEIVDGNPDGRFSIKPTPNKGDYYIQIHRIAKLYSHAYIYNLTLRAEDNGIPPRASYKQVPIHFMPQTNTLPVFTKELYEISIPETSPPNMPVIRLKVCDPQLGQHAHMVYLEIVGGNEGGEFRINAETGMLYTQKRLDAERKAFYTLTVSAIDQANVGVRKQSSAKVKINIQDMNDNNPIFEPLNTTIIINENELAGTYVAKLTARDKDLGENSYISYSIANLQEVPFDIDHFTGVLRTSMLLDYETMRRSYMLRIRASDWGLPYRRQTDLLLHVMLQDINDNRPQFERINCLGKVLRHTPVGTDIFTLSAIDFDAADFITYRLLSGNEDGCFNLEVSSGVISIGCDLNAIVQQERVLNVSSTDGMHFSDEMSVRISLVEGLETAAGDSGGYGMFECRETGVARRLGEILAAAERSNAQIEAELAETVKTSDLVFSSSRYAENLHAPEFVDFPQELKINESVALGETIAVIKARDRDLGYNGKLIYAISDGDTDSVFHINADTGEIQIIGYLDRERQDEYVLNITVYDQGQPQKYVSKMIPISILDCNDNKPIYEKSMASFRLTESALNNTIIFCLNASDADMGENGRISYSLQSELPEFYVNESTGCLRLRETLDRERQQQYEFHVIARDHGMPSLSAEAVISITVEDINDNAPIFGVQDFIFKVREDIPRGTVVAAMEVTDFDVGPNGEVQFSLVNDGIEQIKIVEKEKFKEKLGVDFSNYEDNTDDYSVVEMEKGLFKIDKYTGVIRTQGYLDYETRQVHNLIVSAIDRGTPSLTSNMPIVIEVIDVNENRYAPEFDDFVYTARVRENQPIGSIVRNITARDMDISGPDSKIAYSIRGGDGLGVFGVNDLGCIRTLSHLDAETKDSYWLTLCAQDHAIVPLSSCVQVYIEVINVNDNVPLTSRPAYYESIAEGSPANITIMQLEAIDADNDPQLEIVYNIISGNAEGFFVIDPETGELKTSERKLDRENQAEHILEISVKDNGEPPLASTTRVVITVLDVNDNTPTFDQRFYKVLVPSTVSMNESIFQVQAYDNDIGENGRITYYIKSGKGRNKFHMNPHNGFIQVTKPLDVGMEYDLNIRAEDNGTPKRQQNAKLNIIVREINQPSLHPPVIRTQESVVDVTESDRPGFLVTLIQAIDEDGDHLWYNISAGDDRNEFYIGRDNGNILLAKPLDWETQTNYNLTICVTDGTHVAKTSLYVRVVDTNDNRPRFTQEVYHINISENIEEESVIIQLHASDDDEDKKIFYTLHAAQDPTSLHLFSIDTFSGNVLVKKRLDYEQNAHHVLIAIAKDQGTPAKRNYAKIIINVHDHNDHAPEFSSKLVQSKIPESAAIGSRIIQLYCRDADSGKNAELRFAIVTGNVGNMFDIDSTLGTITLAKTLNMNEMPEYMLQVKASDLGEPSLSAQVSVHIMVTMAENDPPRFSAPLEPLEMYENLPAGTFVTQVEARSSSTLFYEILAGNDSAFFHINPSTGVIVTNNNNIDYETQRSYNLTISGTNMASAGTKHQVIIHILDVNDNAPVFIKYSYEGEISESAETGSLVHIKSQDKPLLLMANDADMGTNAMLEYRIMDDIAGQFLQIESATGAIKVKQPLDYETITHFHFEVMVFDMGKPKLYSKQNAEVNISVLNVNDCAPKFVNKVLNITLYLPTYENVIVAQVNATDDDDKGMPLNMRTIIRYDIVDGNINKAFKIDSLTGIITTCRTDDLLNNYALRVRASDGLYSSISQVSISVETTDTQGFAFRKNQYMFSAMENTTKTLVIGLVNVVGNLLHENVDYNILNPNPMFDIGHTSGAIKTTGELFDRETQEHYELIIEAKSQLYHNNHNIIRRALTKVHVTILDANDNCPIFVNLPYYSTVSVDDTKGSVVTQVKAVDLDSFENGEVRYELKRGNGELFKIDRKSGEITLRQAIDAQNREYELTVAAYDNAITPCASEVSVHIKVVDRSMPVFDKQFYTDTVRENIEVYTALSLAVQAHSPLKRKLIYTITQGNDNELFEIDYRTAVLYVVNELDYEQQQSHELVIRATDSVSGINAEVTVSIIVEDANDCYPLIEQDNYNITLSENLLFGTQFLKINATDCDTKANSELSYFIESINGRNDTDTVFYIDMNEGTMFLKSTLDYEAQQSYHIVVVVKDHGTPSLKSKSNVWITVRDLNDNAPRFVEPSFSCRMSVLATRGQFVIITQAVDLDDIDNGKLKYQIVGGNELQTYSIEPQTGIITLLNMQNFTDHQQTILNVSVTDGVHTNYARVKILLLPENQNSPIFMQSVYIARLRENLPAPAHVITVQATDDDFGKYAKIAYEIATEDMHEYFSIDEHTGMISSKSAFDREQRDLYEMLVKAVDLGGRFSFALIKIKIEDENDNAPYFHIKEYKAVLNANISINSTILQIKASDLDDEENALVHYSIDPSTLEAVYAEYVSIGAIDGYLSINKSLKDLINERIQFFVRAIDRGKPQKHSSVPVTLQIVAPNVTLPLFEKQTLQLQVTESTPPGSVLHKLQVLGNYSYNFSSVSQNEQLLSSIYISDTGEVILAQTLDREAQASLHIVAQAATNTIPALYTTCDIYVQVQDENDNYPSFDSNIYHVELPENMPASSSIIKINALDKDMGSNGEIRYALENDTHSIAQIFEIDMYTGWITTLTSFDREQQSEYFFDVLARDNAQSLHVSKVPVVIKITDYNDNAPKFKQPSYNISVEENARPGFVLTHFLLTDQDAALQDMSYYIVSGDTQARFQLGTRTGELYVARALDREKQSAYALQLYATDGKYLAQAQVQINLLDVNDNKPYCLQSRYRLQVNESVAIGTPLQLIKAQDADIGHNARLRYYLTGNGSDDFSIDKETGMLRVAKKLDRETTAHYILQAHAQDGHELWRECRVELLIQVLDLNDNPPEFAMPEILVSIYEDAPLNTLVTKVHASDRDAARNRKLSYAFVEPQTHFNICAETGIIKLVQSLDREQIASYNLSIRAQDAGEPPLAAQARLIVNVLDINDNPPEFTMKQYITYVLENATLQAEIARVHATSKDVGVNAEVSYYITAGNEQQRFGMHAKTGGLHVRQSLDYEKTKSYFLTVQAIDGGTPPLSQLAFVNITVIDVNDNQPQFRQAVYRVRVSEAAAIGQELLQLSATDEDSGAFGHISYALTQGDRFSQFHLDAESGNLSVARALDRETIASYALQAQACDGGTPALCNFVQIHVTVLDTNDNEPRFSEQNYTVMLQENKPLGHLVLQFNISDADEAHNAAPYTFDLRAGNECGCFRMEPDGRMLTAARFNHLVKDHYALLIRVFDSGTPPLYSDAWIHVHVIEESQYPPVIVPLEITVNSYEDDFSGGVHLGRVYASDQDQYDTLYYDFAANTGERQLPSNKLFNISHTNGTLWAVGALDIGLYRINVTVSDGKFTSSAIIKLNVELITLEMVRHAAIVRFSKVSAEDFILSQRKGFLRGIRSILRCRQKDIVLITLAKQLINGTQHLDVVFAVHKQQIVPTAEAYLTAEEIRLSILANLEQIELQTSLVISEVPALVCQTQICAHGDCQSRIDLLPRQLVTYATDVISFALPRFQQLQQCVCQPGYGGQRCEQSINACSTAPCPPQKQCWPADTLSGYQCICPRGYTGVYCEQKANFSKYSHAQNMSNTQSVALLSDSLTAVSFSGKSYAHYKLNKALAKHTIEQQSLYTLRIRTVQQTGTLLYASGKVDYNVLEVVNGAVQYRFDLGSGEGIVSVSSVYVSDGEWHAISVERVLGSAKLTVDEKHVAQGSAPGVNSMLNIHTHDVFVGAEVRPHAAILGFEDIQRGFIGCMSDIRIALEPLPLYIAGGSAIAALKRFNNVDFHCDAAAVLTRLGVCGAQPCLNGGVCSNLGNNNFECMCHKRFSGSRCELDLEPCASTPCLFGGRCVHLGASNYSCVCPAHLSGRRCEYGKFCTPNPCQNGGICEEGDGMPHCMCRGYTGHTCELDVDECENQPCGNGATCINEPGSFRCICPAYLTGASCGDPLYSNSITSKLRNLSFEHLAAILLGFLLLVVLISGISCCLVVRRHRRGNRNRAKIAGAKTKNGHFKEAQLNSLLDNKKHKYSNSNTNRNTTAQHANATKLINLEINQRPMSYSTANDNLLHSSTAFVNNLDILRSYGSAGDELENIPVEYQKINRSNNQPININAYNLSETELSNKHDWCNQMQLKTFSENKLNNERIAPNNRLASLKASCGKLIHVDVPNVCHPVSTGHVTPPTATTTAATSNASVPSVSAAVTPSTSSAGQCVALNCEYPPYNAGQYHWDCSDWVRKSQNPLPDITEVPGAEIADSSSLHSNDSNESKPHSPYIVQNIGSVDPVRDMTTLNEDLTSEYVDSELESCLQPFELPLIKSKSISRLNPQPSSENEDYKLNTNKVFLCHPNSYLPSMTTPSETEGESSANEAFLERLHNNDPTAASQQLAEEEFLMGKLRRNHNHHHHHHHHHAHPHTRHAHHHHQNNSSQSDLSVHLCEIEDSELEEFLPKKSTEDR